MAERMFISELKGCDVKTNDGKPLGRFDEVVVDTGSGEIVYILVANPTEHCAPFKTDPKGRKVVEFKNMATSGNSLILYL